MIESGRIFPSRVTWSWCSALRDSSTRRRSAGVKGRAIPDYGLPPSDISGVVSRPHGVGEVCYATDPGRRRGTVADGRRRPTSSPWPTTRSSGTRTRRLDFRHRSSGARHHPKVGTEKDNVCLQAGLRPRRRRPGRLRPRGCSWQPTTNTKTGGTLQALTEADRGGARATSPGKVAPARLGADRHCTGSGSATCSGDSAGRNWSWPRSRGEGRRGPTGARAWGAGSWSGRSRRTRSRPSGRPRSSTTRSTPSTTSSSSTSTATAGMRWSSPPGRASSSSSATRGRVAGRGGPRLGDGQPGISGRTRGRARSRSASSGMGADTSPRSSPGTGSRWWSTRRRSLGRRPLGSQGRRRAGQVGPRRLVRRPRRRRRRRGRHRPARPQRPGRRGLPRGRASYAYDPQSGRRLLSSRHFDRHVAGDRRRRTSSPRPRTHNVVAEGR